MNRMKKDGRDYLELDSVIMLFFTKRIFIFFFVGQFLKYFFKILNNTPRYININIQYSMSDELKKCWRILKQLQKHESAYPFLVPVDPVLLEIPDYPEIVKEPMDL